MLNLFGKKKTKAQREAKKKGKSAPTTMDSIAKMKATVATQEKRKAHLQKKMADCLRQAKAKSKAKDKRGAMMCLKRKKMYEKEVAKMDAVQMTLEQQCFAIEGAQGNVEAVNAMSIGKNQMAAMQRGMNVDDVADLRDQITEQQDQANEVSDLLAEGMGSSALDDEDELLAELEGLDEEEADIMGLQMPSAPSTAPQGRTTTTTTTAEEDEEAEMLAQLAM